MYNIVMKKRDLEKELRACGWLFLRPGGNHDIWTNGEINEPVPRRTEINEFTARAIIRKARNNPAKKRKE